MTSLLPKLRRLVAAAILVSFALSADARAAGISFTDDFQDGSATDGVPVTWAVSANNPVQSAEVVNGDFVLTASNSDDGSVFVEETLDDLTGDVSARAQLRFLSPIASGGVFVRGDDNSSYFAGLTPFGLVFLGEGFGGVFDEFISGPSGVNPSQQDVDIQIDVIGNSVSVTVWSSGTPMPDQPQLGFFDSTPILFGAVGVFIDPLGDPGSLAVREFELVPEPTGLVLAVLATLGFSFYRRPRRRA